MGRGTAQNKKEILAFAAISLFNGAEGQNRTADTGIFSPLFFIFPQFLIFRVYL